MVEGEKCEDSCWLRAVACEDRILLTGVGPGSDDAGAAVGGVEEERKARVLPGAASVNVNAGTARHRDTRCRDSLGAVCAMKGSMQIDEDRRGLMAALRS